MMASYLKLGDIKGESHDSEHTGWIDIMSFNWGMSQSASSHLKTGATNARCSVNDVQIVKDLDVSSTKIMEFCTTGTPIAQAIIDFCLAGGKQVCYFQMTMDQVIISSYNLSGTGSDEQLNEVITLNFSKYKVEKWEINNDTLARGKSQVGAFDIRANKKPA